VPGRLPGPEPLAPVPARRDTGSMSVTLSIKNAPEAVVRLLERRAARHHRSLQGELLALVEAAAREEEVGLLSAADLLDAARAAGVGSRGRSAALVRGMRGKRLGTPRR